MAQALAPQVLADGEEAAPIVEAGQLVAQREIGETLLHALTLDALPQ